MWTVQLAAVNSSIKLNRPQTRRFIKQYTQTWKSSFVVNVDVTRDDKDDKTHEESHMYIETRVDQLNNKAKYIINDNLDDKKLVTKR